MTRQRFVQLIEAYYGRYERPAQRDMVAQYLAKFHERCLDTLFQRLLLEYSGQYRFTPDVAVLEGIKRKIDTDALGWPQAKNLLPESTEPCVPREKAASFMAEVLGKIVKHVKAGGRSKTEQAK